MADNNEVIRHLGVLQGKMDAVLERTDRIRSDVKLLEGRIRTLEKWQSWLMGIGAAGMLALTTVLSDVWNWLTGH